jgi:hypothetical protein
MRQSGQQTTGRSAALHGGYSPKSGYIAALRYVKRWAKTCREHLQQSHEANSETWHRAALSGTLAIGVF